jgi:hypothetical protein
MWLFKPKAPRCKFCAGTFGLARPHFPFCSAYCEAWFEHPTEQLEPLPYNPADTMPSNR